MLTIFSISPTLCKLRHRPDGFAEQFAAAHFPPNIRPLEEFDPEELESGITQAQLDRLKELSWLDNGGNLVFAGPLGLGKTMVAVGLGLHAIRPTRRSWTGLR